MNAVKTGPLSNPDVYARVMAGDDLEKAVRIVWLEMLRGGDRGGKYGTAKARVIELLSDYREYTATDVAKRLGIEKTHAGRILRDYTDTEDLHRYQFGNQWVYFKPKPEGLLI